MIQNNHQFNFDINYSPQYKCAFETNPIPKKHFKKLDPLVVLKDI
jgi:hypothetical protein